MPDTEGRNHWVRFYKDTEKGSAHYARLSWKHGYSPRSYSKDPPSPTTTSDTSPGYRYFTYDTTRIYVNDSLNEYMPLFESGVLSIRTFYCPIQDTCRVPDMSCDWRLETGEPLISGLLGWKGQTTIVHRIEELSVPGTRKKSRRFRLFASIPCQYGYTIYMFELTNTGVKKTVDLSTFCTGAELTFFEYHVTQI